MPKDIFANQGYITLTPTLNTLSFAELASYMSVFEKRALLINRVEYFFSIASLREMDAETDTLYFGLSTSDGFAQASIGEASIFDYNAIVTVLQAAGVSSQLLREPFQKDFSTMPGGGILIPSRPIFLWMHSLGWAAAGSAEARLFFTVKELKAEEYWELVESTRLIGS